MATLQFNRLHKNGWLSWKIAGVHGAVFIDKRMLPAEVLENPPAELTVDIQLVEPGAEATAKAAAMSAKKLEREQKRIQKAEAVAAKAAAKLQKLQETAAKAQAIVDAAKAKVEAAAQANQ